MIICLDQVSIQDLTGQDIKLLLSVVRAYDVPVRSDPDPLASHDGPKEALVHSYIEARFQVKRVLVFLLLLEFTRSNFLLATRVFHQSKRT